MTVLTANPEHSLSGDSLLRDKPDVDDTYSRSWSVNISMAVLQGPDMNTLLPRGFCVSSLTLCERVIFEQKLTTLLLRIVASFRKRGKYKKNKSQKISMFQKPKCPQKDKVFGKV